MNIPNKLLTAIFRQPAGFAPSNSGQSAVQIAIHSTRFRIGDSDWSYLVSESGKGSNETWFIRPFAKQTPLLDPLPDCSHGESDLWTEDLVKTPILRRYLRTLSQTQGMEDLSSQFCILQAETRIRLLIVNGSDFQLVANLLHLWGTPPLSVIVDWQRQLNSVRNAARELSTFSTAETLITKDGLLLPLSVFIKKHSEDCISDPTTILPVPILFTEACSIPAPDWPGVPTIPNTDPQVRSLLDSISPASPKPKRIHKAVVKRPRVGILVSSVFGIGLSIGAVAYVASRKSQPTQMSEPSPQGRHEEIAATAPELANDSLPIETQELPKAIDPLVDSLDSSEITDSGELTVDSLLAQLQTKPLGLGNLRDISAASIVDGLLPKANSELPNTMTERTADGTAEQVDDAPEAELETLPSSQGPIVLKQPMQIRAARAKEFVSIGKPVNVKSCLCEIELKLSDKWVLEPSTKVAIQGPGKQAWRVAVEDEEPELVLEIESKPGSRWQIIHSVAIRVRSGAPLVLIGPKDSQVVINRLILYKQWLSNSAEYLRKERANRRLKSAIDFTAEIKKLEGLEREMEQAITQWKVVSQLTGLFFNEVEVLIQFNAAEKG